MRSPPALKAPLLLGRRGSGLEGSHAFPGGVGGGRREAAERYGGRRAVPVLPPGVLGLWPGWFRSVRPRRAPAPPGRGGSMRAEPPGGSGPGQAAVVVRTIVIRSARLPRRVFRIFAEIEGMYRNMVEQLTMFAVREGIKSHIKLRVLKYRELVALYPQLPSHYAYTACQDAAARAKSFLRLKRKGLARGEYPEVRRVSVWLDDKLWRLNGLTAIEVATHKGWVRVELEPHKHFWRYINGWRLASGARVKLDRRGRRLVFYPAFEKSVEAYEPRGFMSVDVNEDNVAVLIDGSVYLFETGMKKLVLGYYYRRKRVQERCGADLRTQRKVFRRSKERRRKQDIRWKVANIIVGAAGERRCAIVLERLGKNPARGMLEHVKDDQLRHRIYQAGFRGVQRAIEEKAKERGVPVVYVNPRNTSRLCPVHNAPIIYENGSRVGKCTAGGELWHRDAAACRNLLLRARGNGSNAPSPAAQALDGSPMPPGSTATHDPTEIPKSLWARWKRGPPRAR